MKSKQLIIGLLAVVLVAVGGFMLVKNDDSQKTSNQESSSAESDNKSSDSKTSSSPVSLKLQTVGQQPDCSLYNFEELNKIWGVTFTDTDVDGSKVTELTGPGTKLYECDYNETNSGKGVSYIIQYKEYATEDAAKNEMTGVRGSAKFGDKIYYIQEEKSGVGDEAFFSKSNGTGSLANANQQMYIRKGNVVFLLSGVNLDGVDDSYKEKLVASYKLHFE